MHGAREGAELPRVLAEMVLRQEGFGSTREDLPAPLGASFLSERKGALDDDEQERGEVWHRAGRGGGSGGLQASTREGNGSKGGQWAGGWVP